MFVKNQKKLKKSKQKFLNQNFFKNQKLFLNKFFCKKSKNF